MNHDVTVLGLGLMGRALAGAFLRDGHPTTVWNRTAEKAGDLVGQGARLAASPGEAVAAAPLTVICVSDHDAVLGLLDRLGGDLGGRVLVNLTSGTPAAARETAARVTRRGGAYLDGAIMAVPQAIGTPDATVLYSGSREAFDRYEPVLKSLRAADRRRRVPGHRRHHRHPPGRDAAPHRGERGARGRRRTAEVRQGPDGPRGRRRARRQRLRGDDQAVPQGLTDSLGPSLT